MREIGITKPWMTTQKLIKWFCYNCNVCFSAFNEGNSMKKRNETCIHAYFSETFFFFESLLLTHNFKFHFTTWLYVTMIIYYQIWHSFNMFKNSLLKRRDHPVCKLTFKLFVLQLPNEEDSEESPQVAAEAPPPYSSIAADSPGKSDSFWVDPLMLRCIYIRSILGNYINYGLNRSNLRKQASTRSTLPEKHEWQPLHHIT